MTQLTLDIKKSIEQNASDYFEKAKKARKKMQGAKDAIDKLKGRLSAVEKSNALLEAGEKAKVAKLKRALEWYEKFHWFISSEGFLCIGGRDATTNEIVIKKHTDKEDLVFHTEAPGSPFFVVKTSSAEGEPSEITFNEAAIATAAFSKAWKLGVGNLEVFMVKPDQVSKEAKAGEYIAKGAFMIYGKREYFNPKIEFAIGITHEGKIMSGPLSALQKNCEKFISVEQGNDKTSAVAKQIQKNIGGDLDEIVRALPAGGCKLKKQR